MPDSLSVSRSASTSIASTMLDAAALVSDPNLAAEIRRAVHQEAGSVARAEYCFTHLTSRAWPRGTLERFFHGWRDTHLTSSYVAAMICRILSASRDEHQSGQQRSELCSAAAETGHIIHEDLGLCGETHGEMFNRLATSVCDGDGWLNGKNSVPSALSFRKWVEQQRVRAEDIKDGLMTTIASEIYNHGEYTFIAPLFEAWLLEKLGFSPKKVKRDMAYIVVHTGETESGHFLHGIEALRLYCSATGVETDYRRVGDICAEYLQRVGAALDGMTSRLN